jgi:hypothetical protein
MQLGGSSFTASSRELEDGIRQYYYNSHCNNIFEVSVVLSEEPKDPKPPRLEIPEGAASKYTSFIC